METQQQLNTLLQKIVSTPNLHTKWLNTLSMMENTGARKIAAYENPQKVTYTILKHASEEFRHAFYLKKLIQKVDENACPTYESQYVLVPIQSAQYLHSLDIFTCRFLKEKLKITNIEQYKFIAYLLVTYAIEVRADSLYPAYQEVLKEIGSKVNVRSIIVEEEGHLAEMIAMLENFSPNWAEYAKEIVNYESSLFTNWVSCLEKEICR